MAPDPPRVNPGETPDFPATANDINALREAISPARLTTYLNRAHNNVRRAFYLYAWNIQASAALYPILQANEIALRNAVNRALISQFGSQWPYSQGFLRSLHKPERETFENGRSKLERKLGLGRVSTGDVVAAQTYWFWVMLLTSRFQQRIWSREFVNSFPHAPPRINRNIVHTRADSIRQLRNRIAHYEPLLDYDLIAVYQRAASMVRWISSANATWAALRWPTDPRILRLP
jgi:hypothetical protein